MALSATARPCIVVSDSEKHTLKYVVLSDRLIYLTENPPKSIRRVVALRDVVAIDLIDDYPEFLSPPDRETNQHIRITYYSTVLKKECEKSKGVRKFLFPFHHANANNKKEKILENLILKNKEKPLLARGLEYVLSISGLDIFTDLKILVSEEKIKHFGQLKSELFLKDNTLRKILCLITELKIAAQNNFILKRLFWQTSDLFNFLVNKLHEYLPESRDKNALQNKSQRADELVGTLFNLLVILISEPQIPKSCPVFDIQLVADSNLVEMSFDAEITFVASIVKQVVKGLSASYQLLSPGQAVLLYQQFYILKSCLQHSKTLAEYIRNDYREEFRNKTV
ncbi:hypothetical protein CB1_001749006 [Camelus ferus]|nr:hypothetical protein CB1_001749006 [Camelus ferus]